MVDAHEAPTTERPARRRCVPAREWFDRLLASESFRWWLAFGVLSVFAAVRSATSLERDPFWSARAGVENLEGSQLVRADTWSWSTDGVWYPNSPGWNIVLGLGWQALGFWGIFVAGFLAITLMFGLALLLARLAGARALPTLVGITPILLAATSGFSPRATVVVQCLIFVGVLFAWWWVGIARRMRPGISWLVIATVGFALSLLGNWVHVSFMFMAGAIAVMWAIAWWSSPGLTMAARVGHVMAGSLGLLLGCVLSPYGIELTLERSRVVDRIARGLVSEWMSVLDFLARAEYQAIPIAVIALSAIVGCTFWVGRLHRRGGRFDARMRIILPLALFGILAVCAGFGTVRFLAVGLVAILPVAGAAATDAVDALRQRQRTTSGYWSRPRVMAYTSGRFLTVVILIVGLIVAPLAASRIAVGALPAEARIAERIPEGCRVWAKIGAAGPIILTRPDTEVWIDGRVDFYGRDRVVEYAQILLGQSPLPEQTGCVVLPSPALDPFPLADSLDDDPTWARTAEAEGFVLWVRQD